MQNINIYCIRVHCTVLYNKYTAVGYSFAKFFIADFLSIDWMGGGRELAMPANLILPTDLIALYP